MNLNKNIIVVYFLTFFSSLSFAQHITKKEDTTGLEKLEEVIITGQHNAQSVKKSIFEVKLITRKDIEQYAANSLADLLNQTLNINITPNPSTGKSGVSLFGLDAQYFKILIDNIPVINEEGFGNNTDLTLINLDDIEQIEIVEGALGVQYGSNAVSGIINIITKKSSTQKLELNTYLQEESVGNEYEWFDKGKHIQSVKIGHQFIGNFYGNIGYTRNDFGGFWDQKKGNKYDRNDGLRGHKWLPKEQHNTKLLLNYKENGFNAFYKFDYFNETIDKYNTVVDLNENPATDTSDPLALDEIYTNNRFYHHLNTNGTISRGVNYNISLSYQEQTKNIERFTYRIRKGEKTNILKDKYLSRTVLFSRGSFSNLIATKTLAIQAGYEITNEKGFGSPLAITINPKENNVKQRLDHYDLFTSSEINVSNRFSLRPGARVSFSNLFKNQYVFSLSSKHVFKNDIEFRTIIGSANRTPNYNELYTYFVDVNHNTQGNPNLTPEQGLSAFIHIKKHHQLFNNQLLFKNKISLSYINLKDKIELILVKQNPLAYKYNNVNKYTSIGVFSENHIQYKNLKAQFGISVIGISKNFKTATNPNNNFLYNLQLNSSISYLIQKWNSSFSCNLKHVGKQLVFVEKINTKKGNQEYSEGTTDAYNWIDVTFRKTFLKNKIVTTFGIRNLLDISSANTTALSGGAHNDDPTSLLLGYGRSYFVKFAYNLKL